MTGTEPQHMLIVDSLFDEQKRDKFDFSQAPTLIRRKGELTQPSDLFSEQELSQWTQAQDLLIRWTKDQQIFNHEYVQSGKAIYAGYFKSHDVLNGNVLDIGGGWGLFREWWEGEPSSVFIVHDPGVDRFVNGAHELHRQIYARAFSLPMTFVEGFGEELPYSEGMLDTCLISSALDHCVDPMRVFSGAYRCLKPDGTFLIFQQCEGEQNEQQNEAKIAQRSLAQKLIKALTNPQRALAALRVRLFYREPHLHHFSVSSIQALLEQAGYRNIEAELVPTTKNIYAFKAMKA